MACIAEVLDFCREGGSALITIEGPPGMGKTRLLRESLTVGRSLGLCPELTTLNEQLAPRFSRDQQVPPVGGRPLVKAVDNAHHMSDEEVNALVSKNGGDHHGVPTAWILARRTRVGAPPLDNFISSPIARNERILLGPLTESAALETATDVLGALPTPELAQVLFRAGGHPRRLHELLEGMREENSIAVSGHRAVLTQDRIPHSLTLRVRRSLLGYSDTFRQVVRVAATLGQEVSFGQVAAMMQMSPLELLPVLDELVSAGALVHHGDKLVFSDELLWRLVADWVPPTVREALQQQAAAQNNTAWRPTGLPDDDGDELRPGGSGSSEEGPEVILEGFGEKENTIIQLVCKGQTNQQVARRLRLSPHTVNYHLRKIFRAFGVNSRVELIRAVQQRTGPAAETPESDRRR
ncbi:helix-turn-helix transcriptional regulator [Streptomyces tubercidicus]|uniref:helix-turn-helix transcriptional regulator n=1 Tax=Streptomyces tubercidicus TaxID=47759 RepID=UPI00346634FC